MRFTEHELTAGLHGAAKAVLTAQTKDIRKGKLDVNDVWERLPKFQRFKLLDTLGDQILPVLVGLPDVEIAAGERASYSDEQIWQEVESRVSADEAGGRLKRKAVIAAQVALVKAAIGAMPPRSDPDGLIVPDHL